MFPFGPFTIHLYGVIIGIGVLVGFWVARRMASKFKVKSEKLKVSDGEVWGVLWWGVIPGVVGARIYHVVDLWEYYRAHLLLIPAVWTGGLGIFGAIVGGVVGLWGNCLRL